MDWNEVSPIKQATLNSPISVSYHLELCVAIKYHLYYQVLPRKIHIMFFDVQTKYMYDFVSIVHLE